MSDPIPMLGLAPDAPALTLIAALVVLKWWWDKP